jgi:two-component system sensor histidine kinase/response regulator
VVISAYAGKEEEARCAELGVNVFLHKPITASSFFDALAQAEGALVRSGRRAADEPLVREFVGLRALLAEDNPANQMVAAELLSRLGIELEIANNGREAVDKVIAQPDRYAAVLMDVQMPEMDGLAATRAIRASPHAASLPIIAMTANAMKVDLDACLAAGMNDHVIKPIDRHVLLQTLRRWLPSTGAPTTSAVDGPAAAPRPEGAVSLEGLDLTGASQRLGLDFDRLRAMLARFGDGLPQRLAALRAAVASGDALDVARHAHAIVGAAGNLGVDALRHAAKALEQAARAGRTEVSDLVSDVEQCAAVALRSIETLGNGATAPVLTSAPFDAAAVRAVLERLQAALGNFELSAANAALAELTALGVSRWADSDLGRLRDRMDSYAYDEARVVVASLVARLERTSSP